MTTKSEMVLVTGATGFLGNYIVSSYCKRNIHVKAFVRPTSNLSWLEPLVDAQKVTLAYGSMTDANSLYQAMQDVTHVVHSASVIGPKISNETYQKINVEGTQILLELAIAHRVQRFILISSVSTYGIGITPGGIVTEDTMQKPSNPYGQSKLAQQKLVFDAYHNHGLAVVSIEPPVIYGPRARVGVGQAIKIIKNRIAPLLDYGRGRINLVYVTDVVGLLEATDASGNAIGERFLAPGPRFVSHREVLDLLADNLNVKPIYVPIPLPLTVAGMTINNAILKARKKDVFFPNTYMIKFTKGADYRADKAKRLLGWKPKVDVREGIPKTVKWFLDNGFV